LSAEAIVLGMGHSGAVVMVKWQAKG